MNESLKHFINLMETTSLNEIVYWYDPRPTFEILYVHRKELKEHFPNKAEIIDELCETNSQQSFLKVLQKYQTEEDKKNIWVHENEDGCLYLI